MNQKGSSEMITMYQVVQFLDLAEVAKEGLKAARDKAERVGLPECARAIDVVTSDLDKAVGLVHKYEVKKRKID